MIATGERLRGLLKERMLVIDPILEEDQIKDASIDLRLDNRFLLLRKSRVTHITSSEREAIKDYSELIEIEPLSGTLALHPNDLVIGQTFEYIKIPLDVYGILDGRSSLARLGIVVHATAMSIDPGFEGHISFEIVNMGPTPVQVFPLTRVARLILLDTFSKVGKKDTKYSSDIYPSPSRLWMDEDLAEWVNGRKKIDLERSNT